MSNQLNPSQVFASQPSTTATATPPTQGSPSAGGHALTYGFLVMAKRALYELQDNYNEIQIIESKIAQQMYRLTKIFGNFLGKSTLESFNRQADGMQQNAIMTMALGGAQMFIAGAQVYANNNIDKQIAPLTDEEESLQPYKAALNDPERTVGTERGLQSGDTPEQRVNRPLTKETTERLEEFKRGQFKSKYESETVNKDAVEAATEDEVKDINEKLDQRLTQIANQKSTLAAEKNKYSGYAQLASGAAQGTLSGTGQLLQSQQTREQAVQEEIKNVSQTTLQMINPSDATKQMDTFQQDSINVLQIIQAIETANKFQPASS